MAKIVQKEKNPHVIVSGDMGREAIRSCGSEKLPLTSIGVDLEREQAWRIVEREAAGASSLWVVSVTKSPLELTKDPRWEQRMGPPVRVIKSRGFQIVEYAGLPGGGRALRPHDLFMTQTGTPERRKCQKREASCLHVAPDRRRFRFSRLVWILPPLFHVRCSAFVHNDPGSSR
jgi:hypothetical protein